MKKHSEASKPVKKSELFPEVVDSVWSCKIGSLGRRVYNGLQPGSDSSMRQAAKESYKELTGEDAEFCFSGWGSGLTEGQLAVVENWHAREKPEPVKKKLVWKKASDGLKEALIGNFRGEPIKAFISCTENGIACWGIYIGMQCICICSGTAVSFSEAKREAAKAAKELGEIFQARFGVGGVSNAE